MIFSDFLFFVIFLEKPIFPIFNELQYIVEAADSCYCNY